MFEGIDARMEKEIKALAPQSMKIKIVAPPVSAQSHLTAHREKRSASLNAMLMFHFLFVCVSPHCLGAQVLRLDRRIYLGFSVHLPADVDLQAGQYTRQIQRAVRQSCSSAVHALTHASFLCVCFLLQEYDESGPQIVHRKCF